MSTVKRLEKIEKNGEKPVRDCKIAMCGELAPGEDDGMAPKGKKSIYDRIRNFNTIHTYFFI